MTDQRPERWGKLGDEFHMLIGYCIAAWADVDDVLFRIFHHCVGPRDQCAIIYYKTPGLEARFTLTDEIVKSRLPKRERKDGGHDHASVIAWNAAKKGHSQLLAMRRRIAHHPVTIRIDYERATGMRPLGAAPTGSMGGDIVSWFEIYMSDSEKIRGHSSDLPSLQLKDLEDHLALVGALGDRLLRFHIEVLTKPPSG